MLDPLLTLGVLGGMCVPRDVDVGVSCSCVLIDVVTKRMRHVK